MAEARYQVDLSEVDEATVHRLIDSFEDFVARWLFKRSLWATLLAWARNQP